MLDLRLKETLSFIENNEEILNDEKRTMLLLGLQYFKTMLLSFFFSESKN